MMDDIDIELFSVDDSDSSIKVPMYETAVAAGFPSPSEDYFQLSIDLNKELIKHPASTFYARVSGVSMVDDGVDDGDLLVIDRSVTPADGMLAVCFIDNAFTLKRIKIEKECIWLMPANKDYKPIQVTNDNEFAVWGIVQYIIKKVV